MLSRRQVLYRGLGAVLVGLGGPDVLRARTSEPRPRNPSGSRDGSPFRLLPNSVPSVVIGGIPFSPDFHGDGFANDNIPFHANENPFLDRRLPPISEHVQVAVIGGGMSGLSTAYLLREKRPVVFELQDHFGGVSRGERWHDVRYSLGGAYIITPDDGSFLDDLYREIGLHEVFRLDEGESEIERAGQVVDDFWQAADLTQIERLAFRRYAQLVTRMAEDDYPCIPLTGDPDYDAWVKELDSMSLREHVELELNGLPIPMLLESAVQAYCYSSFCAGWQEISAASGWNFVAAEEFGRWVFPGANTYIVHEFWRRLRQNASDGQPAASLRPSTRVIDVRLMDDRKVRVTYRTPEGRYRSMLADQAVVACSKHIAKYFLHDLKFSQRTAMDALQTRAYVVANVLLDRPLERNFYDIFLLGSGPYPTTEGEFANWSRVTDVLNGVFATPSLDRSVLTLYWPLAHDRGRFDVIDPNAWQTFASELVPQIVRMLALAGRTRADIYQVRIVRWGHAMPLSAVGFIQQGTAQAMSASIGDRIHFVNQDNWALPAVENCLLDAESVARLIRG